MTEIDKKRIVRAKAIARFAKFIEKHLYNTDWPLVADECSVLHILDMPEHERLRQAQTFGDADYPDEIAKFLKDVFSKDEQIGQLLVREIALHENPYDEPLSADARAELEQITTLFGGQDFDFQSLIQNAQSKEDSPFVDQTRIEELQNISSQEFDLMKLIQLCKELNICYANDAFLSVTMLTRTVLNHVPPIFGYTKFEDVANQYQGSSFKKSMMHLQNS